MALENSIKFNINYLDLFFEKIKNAKEKAIIDAIPHIKTKGLYPS